MKKYEASVANPSIATGMTVAAGNTKNNSSASAWFIYFLSIFVFAIIFGIMQAEPVPLYDHFLGVALAALCIFPTALWYARKSKEYPVFELICLAYLASYVMPLYWQTNQIYLHSFYFTFSWDSTTQVLVYTLLGLGTMIAGYYLIRYSKPIQNLPAIDVPIESTNRHRYFVFAGIIGLLVTFGTQLGLLQVSSAFGQIINLFSNQAYIAIILLTNDRYVSNDKSFWSSTYLTLLLVGNVLVGLASGLLENAVLPIILFLVVRWGITRRIPVLLLTLAFIAFIMLNAVKAEYRALIWYGDTPTGITERLTTWLDASSHLVTGLSEADPNQDIYYLMRESTVRLDYLHNFVLVYDDTPKYVPYYEGQTYTYLLYAWIPRILWPDKPVAQLANAMVGLDYGILDPSSVETTSVGLGQPAEAYANFGVWGVIIVMGLQGIFFAVLDSLLNKPKSDGGRAIYLSIMIFFLNGIGTTTASLFGAVIQNVISNVLILRFFNSDLITRLLESFKRPEVTKQNIARRNTARRF